MAKIVCPKCGHESGDSWTQCRGACPMRQSPHYKPNAPNNAPRRAVEDVEQGLSVDDRCDFGGDAIGE